MKKTVLKCGLLFDGTSETPLENMAVGIEGNRIVRVSPWAEAEKAEAEVVDLSGRFVMPGLIDAHVHVNMDGEPNIDGIYRQTEGELALRSMVRAQKDLMAGFTTIRDEGAVGFTDVAVRDAIDSGFISGPRMFVSGVAISSTGGHGDTDFSPAVSGGSFGTIVNSPDEARKAARYTFKYGADQIKIMATGGVMSNGDEPGAPELSFEEMKAALDIANSRGRISSAHAHGAEGIKNAIRAGITSIEHGMLIDREGMEMMKEYGVYLIPTIIAAHRIVEFAEGGRLPEWMARKAKQCLENHGEHLKEMLAMGVKIGFGTDSGTAFNRHGEQAFEFELMTRCGFTPAQALLAATRVNAGLLKWEDRIGTIEEHKLADIVAFDRNPLEDITAMMDCAFVMKDGTIYKQ